jgi:tetratricopeptide (TPR) repeat protein
MSEVGVDSKGDGCHIQAAGGSILNLFFKINLFSKDDTTVPGLDICTNLRKEGSLKEAKRELGILKSKYPNSYKVLAELAQVNLDLNELQEAANLLIDASQYKQDNDRSLINKAYGHYLRKEFVEAKQCLKKAKDKNPSNKEIYSLWIHSSLNEPIKEILKFIPSADKTSPIVEYAQGFWYYENNQFDEAIDLLRKALNGLKDNPSEAINIQKH